MCAQCHNKKMHVHSVKPAGNQTSVRVEQGVSCCTETAVVSATGESGGCCSGGSGGIRKTVTPPGEPKLFL
ncbi:hypothetical protein KDD30_10140 [Photobacterium sp. GJ3]|uniref:hypothetical protein n=1 Tax=Photobacterium sp. GJ3 TaxID=2829502 RepID=UPI001B8CFCCC|nr:hypothetical protein [Photobacterium sp. GJ3]QUJ66524.1 hypothetical protein KDD30_10140 [Photobacterium sp. GJ3]